MNQVSSRPELADPKAYTSAILGKLGDRPPLEVLSNTVGALHRLLDDVEPDRMRRRPFEGKWTPLEILGHLHDTEWVFGFRTRTIAGDETPDIVGIDQDLWAANLRHNERDPVELISEFDNLRMINLRFWRSLSGEQLERVGTHRERGPESLRHMLSLIAGHDLWHLDQLERYLDEA